MSVSKLRGGTNLQLHVVEDVIWRGRVDGADFDDRTLKIFAGRNIAFWPDSTDENDNDLVNIELYADGAVTIAFGSSQKRYTELFLQAFAGTDLGYSGNVKLKKFFFDAGRGMVLSGDIEATTLQDNALSAFTLSGRPTININTDSLEYTCCFDCYEDYFDARVDDFEFDRSCSCTFAPAGAAYCAQGTCASSGSTCVSVSGGCECQAEAYCGDGHCGDGENNNNCCQDCSCPSGSYCVSGSCVDCRNINDCDDPDFCVNHECVECRNDDDCLMTSICVNGVCAIGPTCGDGTCDDDEGMVSCPQDCVISGDGKCYVGQLHRIVGSAPNYAEIITYIKFTELSNPQVGLFWSEYNEGYFGPTRATGSGLTVPISPEDCGYCGDGRCGLPEGKILKAPAGADITGDPNTALENEETCPVDCTECGDGECNGDETQATCPGDCGSPSGMTCEISVNPLSYFGNDAFTADVTVTAKGYSGKLRPRCNVGHGFPLSFIDVVDGVPSTIVCSYPVVSDGATYLIEFRGEEDAVVCRTTINHFGGSSSGSSYDDEGPTIIYLNGFLTYADGTPLDEEVDVTVEVSATGFSWEHIFEDLDISNGMINLPLGDDDVPDHPEFESTSFSLQLLKVYDITVTIETGSGATATFEMHYTR